MNERIHTLIEQATTEERDGFKYFDKAKFAKLLIQECANIDYTNASDGEFSNDDSYLISKVIKHHFGVEK